MEGSNSDKHENTTYQNLYDQLYRPTQTQTSCDECSHQDYEKLGNIPQLQELEIGNSDPSHAATLPKSLNDSMSDCSGKSTIIMTVLLAVFVLGSSLISIVSLATLTQFQIQTRKTQESLMDEIKQFKGLYENQRSQFNKFQVSSLNLSKKFAEIKGFYEMQRSEIANIQDQNLQQNGSLAFLRHQVTNVNRSVTESFQQQVLEIRADIQQLISNMNVTRSTSLPVSPQSLNHTIQQLSSKIGELSRSVFGVNGIRLVGDSQSSGRVEVFVNGKWGTICDDRWDIKDADVVCRMLGYHNASSAPGRAKYGEGIGQILFKDVECIGNESTVLECPKKTTGYCSHSEDASAECN